MTDEVHYDLTPADAAAMTAAFARPAFGAKHWGRHERLRRLLAGMAIGGLVFCLVKLYVLRATSLDLPPWEDGLAFVGALGFVGWKLTPKPLEMAPDDPRLGHRSFTWWAEAFQIAGPGFQSRIDWAAVTELREAEGFLFMVTRWHDIHAVPLRAFEAAGFPDDVATIRDAWQRARGAGA